MLISFCELNCKAVINMKDGRCLGRVCDIVFDRKTTCVTELIVFGRKRCFGLLGREDDICIRWPEVKKIGEDTVLVDIDCKENIRECRDRRGGGFFNKFFA